MNIFINSFLAGKLVASGMYKSFYDIPNIPEIKEINQDGQIIYFIYQENISIQTTLREILPELELYKFFSKQRLSPSLYGGIIVKPGDVIKLQYHNIDTLIEILRSRDENSTAHDIIFIMEKLVCAENITSNFIRNPIAAAQPPLALPSSWRDNVILLIRKKLFRTGDTSNCIDYFKMFKSVKILIEKITNADYYNSDFKLGNTCISTNGDLLAIDLDPKFIKKISVVGSLIPSLPIHQSIHIFRVFMMLQYYISLMINQKQDCYIPIEQTGYSLRQYNEMLHYIRALNEPYRNADKEYRVGSPYDTLIFYTNILRREKGFSHIGGDESEIIENYLLRKQTICGCKEPTDKPMDPASGAAAEPPDDGYGPDIWGGDRSAKYSYKKIIRNNKKKKTLNRRKNKS